jgi:beta-glucosidase
VAGLGLESVVRDGDLALIATPIDVLGVNYYQGEAVSRRPPPEQVDLQAATTREVRSPYPAAEGVHRHPRSLPTTAMGWEVQPEGLTRLLTRVHEEYAGPAGTAIYVTENGAAYDDVVAEDGSIHDTERTEFLRAHLRAVLDAVDAGVPVHGYFYWSLMDNFEWAWGYDKRFGIVRVDYDSQERTIKDSGHAYAAIIAERGLPVAEA